MHRALQISCFGPCLHFGSYQSLCIYSPQLGFPHSWCQLHLYVYNFQISYLHHWSTSGSVFVSWTPPFRRATFISNPNEIKESNNLFLFPLASSLSHTLFQSTVETPGIMTPHSSTLKILPSRHIFGAIPSDNISHSFRSTQANRWHSGISRVVFIFIFHHFTSNISQFQTTGAKWNLPTYFYSISLLFRKIWGACVQNSLSSWVWGHRSFTICS